MLNILLYTKKGRTNNNKLLISEPILIIAYLHNLSTNSKYYLDLEIRLIARFIDTSTGSFSLATIKFLIASK